MNKELLIAFIRKDLDELGVILEGLSETSLLPQSIINLAASKAENIATCLSRLPHIDKEEHPAHSEGVSEKILSDLKDDTSEEVSFFVEEQVSISTELSETISIEQEVSNPQNSELEMSVQTEHQSSDSDVLSGTDEVPFSNVTKESKVVTVGTLSTKISLNESIGKEGKTVGSALANKKIEDLKQSISIADRFRYQRELFAGNGELMNKTLSDLNNMDSVAAALLYMDSNFKWDEELPSVRDFKELVNRKFLE